MTVSTTLDGYPNNLVANCAYAGIHVRAGQSNRIAGNYLCGNKPKIDDSGKETSQLVCDSEVFGLETNCLVP